MRHRHPIETFIVKNFRKIRKQFFTKPRPEGPYIVVNAGIDNVIVALGTQSYAPNWETSYNYRGEVLNLARVVYDYDANYPGIRWWQTHVRGWLRDDGRMELSAHWEPEPTEAGHAHLKGTGYDHELGMKNLRNTIDDSFLDVDTEE